MSVHSSLVSKNTLKRARNVLTRAERIVRLQKDGRWTEGTSVFGLPKVAAEKAVLKKKTKKKKEEGEESDAPTS